MNGGALYKNKFRKRDSDPMLTGTIDLNRSLVQHLQFLIETGQDATLTIVAWKRTDDEDGAYYSVTVMPEQVRLDPTPAPDHEMDL
jgi:hypothetical protein